MIALTALLGFVGLAVGYGLGVAMAGCSRESRAAEHREALGAAYSRGYVQGCKSPAAGLKDFDELLSFGGNAGSDDRAGVALHTVITSQGETTA